MGIRKRTTTLLIVVAIYAAACVLLFFPVVFITLSLDEMIGYGWPGPWLNDVSALNGEEAMFGLQVGGFLAVLILILAAVGAGLVAVTGRRSWIGSVAIGTAVLVVVYSLLWIPMGLVRL